MFSVDFQAGKGKKMKISDIITEFGGFWFYGFSLAFRLKLYLLGQKMQLLLR